MPHPNRCLPPARAMIVAPQPEAVEAGADVLRRGGNALDATLACALVQGVVDPLMAGIGGFGVLHVFDPRSGTHLVLDGQGGCPAACTEGMWADRIEGETRDGFGFVLRGHVNELGHQAVTVPGVLAAMAEAHAALGRLPWPELFPPAIAFAEEGWLIRPHVYTVWTQDERQYGRMDYGEKLGVSEDGRRLYLRPDGGYKRPGERVVNPDLAGTLRLLARDGAAAFYRGELAGAIAEEMRRHGGLLASEDLAGFAPERQAPLEAAYRGWRYTSCPPPGGGVMVAQTLGILERFDLAALGGHNAPEYVRVVAEAMKAATRDKDAHVGDPRFVPVPLDHLLGDAHIDACASAIRAGEKVAVPRLGAAAADPKHTTHVSCVDADGMVVAMTHSLGVPSGVVVPGTGFMLNGCMSVFDPRPGRAGSIAPGKRRFSSMCPSIVFEGDRPVMTLGAPGGTWIALGVLQVLLNVLDWGMGMQEAVMAPRFVATSDIIDISNRITRPTQLALESMGYPVKRSHLTYAFAGVHGISMFDGRLEGGADPQRDGYAAGVA
jgi:gamma-glutamyltranspeptidase / glutathione hydrolase